MGKFFIKQYCPKKVELGVINADSTRDAIKKIDKVDFGYVFKVLCLGTQGSVSKGEYYIIENVDPFVLKGITSDQAEEHANKGIVNDIKPKEEKNATDHTQEVRSVILTTSNMLEGYRVTETLEVISAECVFGMNIFRDLFTEVRDIFGGRSDATQNLLRDARKTCLHELKKEAFLIGANAVIAIDLDYSEITGKGKSMLMLIANGTAVNVEKIDNEFK